MSHGKTSARSSKSGYEASLKESSYGDSYCDSYSTYGTGSEPDYIMLEIRIKQQLDDIGHLQKQNRRLTEDLDLERSQGMQRLRKLDTAAKTAEKRIQELSIELDRSRDDVRHFQELQESQASQMQQLAASKETQDDRKRVEARIQQLEAEILQGKEEIKNGNYESTQQRSGIRKALEECCIAQRLLEASDKERRDLAKKLAELERQDRRQASAMKGAAQGWLRRNREMDVMCEDMRWRMVDTKSGIVGGHSRRAAAGGKEPPGNRLGTGARKSTAAAAAAVSVPSRSSSSGSGSFGKA